MLLAFAFLLGIIWVMSFLVYGVTAVAIHTLALGAAVCGLIHFIHVRRLGNQRPALPAATGPILDKDLPPFQTQSPARTMNPHE